MTVGQRAARNGRHRFHQVVKRPQQGKLAVRPADLVRARIKDERVRRVTEREDEHTRRDTTSSRAATSRALGRVDGTAAIGDIGRLLAQPKEKNNRRHDPDCRRDQEDDAQVACRANSNRLASSGPTAAPKVIHRTVEVNARPRCVGGTDSAIMGVARTRADALAGAIDEAARPERARTSARPAMPARASAGNAYPPATRFRRGPRSDHLPDATLSRLASASALPSMKPMALNRRAQRGQEPRQQGKDRLARDVVEQAGDAEHPDDARQAAHRAQAVGEVARRPPRAAEAVVAAWLGLMTHIAIFTEKAPTCVVHRPRGDDRLSFSRAPQMSHLRSRARGEAT